MLCVTALLASILGAYQQYNVSQIAALSRAIMAGNRSGPLPFRAASADCTSYATDRVAIRIDNGDGSYTKLVSVDDINILHTGSSSVESQSYNIENHLAGCPTLTNIMFENSEVTSHLITANCYESLIAVGSTISSNVNTLFVLGSPNSQNSPLSDSWLNVHVITTSTTIDNPNLVATYPFCVNELDLQAQTRDIADMYTEMVRHLKGFRVTQATSFTDYADAAGSTLTSDWAETQPCLHVVDTIINLLGGVDQSVEFTYETITDASRSRSRDHLSEQGFNVDDYYAYYDEDLPGHSDNIESYDTQIDGFVQALEGLQSGQNEPLWQQCVAFLDAYRMFYVQTMGTRANRVETYHPMSPFSFVELASGKNMHPQELKTPDELYELAWSMDPSTHLVSNRVLTCIYPTPRDYSSAYDTNILNQLRFTARIRISWCFQADLHVGINGVNEGELYQTNGIPYNPFDTSVVSEGYVTLPVETDRIYILYFWDEISYIYIDSAECISNTAQTYCDNNYDPSTLEGYFQNSDASEYDETNDDDQGNGLFLFYAGDYYTHRGTSGTMIINSTTVQAVFVLNPSGPDDDVQTLFRNAFDPNLQLDSIGQNALYSQFTNARNLETTIDWIVSNTHDVLENSVRANMMPLIWPTSVVFDNGLISTGTNWYPLTLAQQEQEEAQYLDACDTAGKIKYTLEPDIDRLKTALEDKDSLSGVTDETIQDELDTTKLKLAELDDAFSQACLTEINEVVTISDTDSNTLPTDECYDEEYANQLEICKNLINDHLSIGGDNDAKLAVLEESCYNDRTVCGDDCNYDTVFKKTIDDCNNKPIDIIRGDYSITVYPSKDFIADCQRQEVYLQWVTTNDVVAIAEDQKTNNNLRRAQEKEALNKAVVAHAKATNTGIDGVKEMFEIAATEKAPSITKSVSIVKASLYHYDSSNVQTPKELQVSISLTGLKTADMAQTNVEIDYAKKPVQRRNPDDGTTEVVLEDDTRVLATTCGQSKLDEYSALLSLGTNGKCNNATGQSTTASVFPSRQFRSVSSTTTTTTDTPDEQHNNDNNSDDDDKLSGGAIAGIVIGSVAGVAAIGYVGYRVSKRQGTASTYNVLQNSL